LFIVDARVSKPGLCGLGSGISFRRMLSILGLIE
jgi:hypothetical protein